MKKFLIISPILIFAILPGFLLADLGANKERDYTDQKYNFSLTIPKYWSDFEKEYTALKGGIVKELYITQQSDVSSRRTKYFLMEAGTPGSVFGLSDKVIQQVAKEEMVDFYINQLFNGLIGYKVSKTYTKEVGGKKIYVVEGSYLEYGPRKVIRNDYFEFVGNNVYHWHFGYFTTHSVHALTLQAISDSIVIK